LGKRRQRKRKRIGEALHEGKSIQPLSERNYPTPTPHESAGVTRRARSFIVERNCVPGGGRGRRNQGDIPLFIEKSQVGFSVSATTSNRARRVRIEGGA